MKKINPLTKTVELTGTGDEAREQAQKYVVDEFMDNSIDPPYRLMVNYATGVGKGKAAVETAIRFFNEVSRGELFIGCHTTAQKQKLWPGELAKWGRMHSFVQNNRIECYRSFSKIKGKHFGLGIFDEFQHITEDSFQLFDNNTFDAILILTATMPKDKEKQKMIQRLTYGRRLIIKADQAIDAGIVNDFEVNVMWLDLDDNPDNRFKMFKNSNTLYTERGGYLKHCSIITMAKRSGNGKWIQSASINRMRYLGACKSKTLAAKYIQRQFQQKGLRFITIASSIAQTYELSDHVFHSESDDRWYNAFRNNETDHLVSVNMIKEGENFDNLGRCLYIQVNRNAGDFDQVTGRTMRLPPGQLAKMLVLAARDTQDETAIKEALENVNPKRISHYTLQKEKYWI